MKKAYFYLSILIISTGLYSCKGDNGEKKIDSSSSTLENKQDSLQKDPTETEITNDSLILSTAEGQMRYMKTSGNWDRYKSGILPQLTEDAPSYAKEILQSDGKRFIVVDKAKMKLFLYDPYGNVEKSYGIACAKNYGTKRRKGDSRTTEGCFKVKGVFDSTNWLFTNDAGYTSPTRGVYGPRFIRLSIPYIGIHGTGSPGSIGRRCSHGCIRVTNDNIMELVKYVEEGMPVIISPGPKDMAVNLKEGSNILAVATEPGTPKAVPGSGPVYEYVEPVKRKSKTSEDAGATKSAEIENTPEEPAANTGSQETSAPSIQTEINQTHPEPVQSQE